MIPAEQLFSGAAPAPEQVEQFLTACHRRIEQRLGTLERAAQAIALRPEEAIAALRSALQFLDSSGALHTQDEEESVFPRLRARMEPGERGYLAQLEHDHAEAGAIHRRLRRLADEASIGNVDAAAVQEAVQQLTSLYRRHIASEDSTLVDDASRLLSPEDREAIAGEMRARRA